MPLPSHPIQAVIFDHDGTLVDSEPLHLKVWQAVLQPHNLSAQEYNHHLSGKPTEKTAQWVIDRFDLDRDAAELEREKKAKLQQQLGRAPYPLMPGAGELLEYLHGLQLPMAVASGATSTEVQHSVDAHNLSPYFASIATGDMVAANKPAPDVYLKAAEELGVAPEHCLAIEDSDSGQLSALAANMFCLRLNTSSQLKPMKNCLLINKLHDAVSFITRARSGVTEQ